MLQAAGFTIERIFGSYHGELFHDTNNASASPRIMILARKTTQETPQNT
jgi:hypothetical protein